MKKIPSPRQLEWADCEIGVIIHQDLQVYEPGYNFRDNWNYTPEASKFNPSSLDTDQWLEAARNLGARYAVLVAKHCSGFSLWPTRAHNYSVASSPWQNGHGDVVADFIRSCKKYGIRPGLYASCCNNAKYKISSGQLVDGTDPVRYRAYLDMVLTQLRELWSNYGELFEVWFDGGFPRPGAEEIIELLASLQPNAIAFQGDPDRHQCVRWIGNERAEAPYPCHGATDTMTAEGGEIEYEFQECFYGNITGRYWAPGEADMPNRDQWAAYQGGWFYQPGEDHTIYPPEFLLDCYFTSVGRNCNFLLGMVIDDRGLVPHADFEQFRRTGELIQGVYMHCAGKTAGEGNTLELAAEAVPVATICLMEDIRYGEAVRTFTVYGFDGSNWRFVAAGSAIGHKRLLRIRAQIFSRWKVVVHEQRPGVTVRFREFSLWT